MEDNVNGMEGIVDVLGSVSGTTEVSGCLTDMLFGVAKVLAEL